MLSAATDRAPAGTATQTLTSGAEQESPAILWGKLQYEIIAALLIFYWLFAPMAAKVFEK